MTEADRTIRRALVTGAGGFIGSHLVEALRRRAEVRAFVRYVSDGSAGNLEELAPSKPIEIVRGDLRDPDAFRNAVQGCDTVFHLAAHISIPYGKLRPRDVFETNTTMTLNALSSARDSGVERLVLVSSSEVYGTARTVPITEDHLLHPQSVYAASKVACDQLALGWARQIGAPEIVVPRPFNTYGPRQSTRAVIPTILSQARRGDQIHLGNTKTTRDFLYVEDTARFMIAAGESGRAAGRVVQAGTGVETSIADLVDLLGRLLGKNLQVVTDSERVRGETEEVERLVADPERARNLLGWKAEVSLEEGLRRTIDYFKGKGTESPAGYRV